MSKKAKLKVVNRAYKIEAGDFHSIEANIPIRNEDGKLCGVTNPRRLVHLHSYGKEAPFFEDPFNGDTTIFTPPLSAHSSSSANMRLEWETGIMASSSSWINTTRPG